MNPQDIPIKVEKDGPGWWHYTVTINGAFRLDGYVRGKPAEARREAEYRYRQEVGP